MLMVHIRESQPGKHKTLHQETITEYLYEHVLDNVHGDVTSRSEILYYRNIGKAGLVRGAGAGAAGEEQGLGDPPWSGGGDSVATAGDFRGTGGTT